MDYHEYGQKLGQALSDYLIARDEFLTLEKKWGNYQQKMEIAASSGRRAKTKLTSHRNLALNACRDGHIIDEELLYYLDQIEDEREVVEAARIQLLKDIRRSYVTTLLGSYKAVRKAYDKLNPLLVELVDVPELISIQTLGSKPIWENRLFEVAWLQEIVGILEQALNTWD